MRIYCIVLVVIASLFTGCTEKTGDLVTPNCDFDHTAMLTHYADSLIIPAFDELQQSIAELKQEGYFFTDGVRDINTLQSLRTAFLRAYRAQQAVSVYYFGPAREQDIMLNERFNTFPLNIAAVEDAISQGTTNIDSLFKTSTGFPALEYLLYGNRAAGTTDAQVIELFEQQPHRGAFFKATLYNMAGKSTAVINAWRNGYRETFIDNTGAAEGSSLAMLVNELNFDYETLKNFKIKRPLGKFDGGIVQPQKAEGYHSNTGLELARKQLENIITVFNGGNGPGLDNYCACLDKGINATRLDIAINQQFEEIQYRLISLQGTLTANLDNNVAGMNDLLDEMQKLVPLIKRDMTSEMGIRITYQDNDGD